MIHKSPSFFYCTNQPVLAMASRFQGSGHVYWSLEERWDSCHFSRRHWRLLLGLQNLGRPTSLQNPLRLRSEHSRRFPLLGEVVTSLCPSRSSSHCLQEVRPSASTMRTNSVIVDQDWSSQISGAITCLRPLAVTRFALDKGADVSWEFLPHTQKVESEYFMLSLKKMVTKPSPSLLRESLFGQPLGRCKVDAEIFRHWFSVVVTLELSGSVKKFWSLGPTPRFQFNCPGVWPGWGDVLRPSNNSTEQTKLKAIPDSSSGTYVSNFQDNLWGVPVPQFGLSFLPAK